MKPLSFLKVALRDYGRVGAIAPISRVASRRIAHTARALAPGGRFVAYQTTLRLFPALRVHFLRVRWQWKPRNLFPYFVIVAEK